MSSMRKNPAVYAGLSGAYVWACPGRAYALTLPDLTGIAAAPYGQFALGFAAGLLLSGGAYGISRLVARRKEEAALEVRVAGELKQRTPEAPVDTVVEPEISSEPERPRAAHMAQEPIAADEPKDAPGHARHMRIDAEIADVEVDAEPVAAPKHARPLDAAPEARPTAEDTVDDPDDYANVAESYVRKRGLRARMAARAAGVADVLSERLGGGDMLDDLPIIERADGTVGDVGTGWWEKALSSSIRHIDDIDPSLIEATDGTSAPVEAVPIVTAAATRPTDGARRSAYISRNVAEVKQGVYPVHRTAAELDGDDLWEMALKAMDERLDRERPVFGEGVPTATELEEVEDIGGSTGPTGFIPFKRPANHPEVVDSSSYVDYLIDDEFSRNPSEVAKESSRDFLRVVQGGSQKSRPLPVQRRAAPRHMAPQERSAVAKEA